MIGAHWIAIFVKNDVATYFDSLGVEETFRRKKRLPKEIKKLIDHKNMATNIYRIHLNDSIIRGYFWRKLVSLSVNKYRKFKNPKISYISDKTLVPLIIYDKPGSNDEK